MEQNFNKAIQKAKQEINSVTYLDTQLLTIYQNFPHMSNDEKEQALDKYEDLLEQRKDMVDEVLDLQSYLYNMISDLSNVKLSKIDKLSHWSKLKKMKKAVDNLIDLEENEDESETVIHKEVPVDKEKLQKTIEAIQSEKKLAKA